MRPVDIIARTARNQCSALSDDGLVRRLGVRYLLVLVAVVKLTVFEQAVVKPL